MTEQPAFQSLLLQTSAQQPHHWPALLMQNLDMHRQKMGTVLFPISKQTQLTTDDGSKTTLSYIQQAQNIYLLHYSPRT